MSQPYSRLIDTRLATLLDGLPAVNIEGARGVGKTWTASRHARTLIAVDDPDERAQLAHLGRRFTASLDYPVVLDEWQRLPETWDRVRRAIDDDPAPGRFILTGSASPAQAPVHTGAGRIVNIRMRPLSLAERSLEAPTISLAALITGDGTGAIEGSTPIDLGRYVDEILRSGFPGIRDLPPVAREAQLDAYLEQTVRHDLADGRARRTRTLTDWLRAYAAGVATTAAYDSIAAAATSTEGSTPAASTTRQYRDLLEEMWILEPVRGWSPSENDFKRLTTSDKHHLCDPALAARLLRTGAAGLLGVGRPAQTALKGVPRRTRMLGPLFESLVTQSVRVYASLCDAAVHHLRDKGGEHEIDLIVEGPDRRVVAIEVKASAAPRPGDTRHLLWLRERLGERLADAVVVTTGSHAYRDRHGIAVVPAALLGP